MAKKKFKFNLKFSYDAPVTISFVIIYAVFFLLNSFVIKNGALEKILASPTTQSGALPFIMKQPLSYFRLLLYIFGSSTDTNYITYLLVFLILVIIESVLLIVSQRKQ